MPFANYTLPKAALSLIQNEELVHRTLALLVEYFGDGARAHAMVLIEDGPDGG